MLVRPHMPRQWGKRGSHMRAEYCRVQLQSHKPFANELAFKEYVWDVHGGDFEAAYEAFATSDAALQTCQDDFTHFELQLDSEQVDDPSLNSKFHDDFAMYRDSSFIPASCHIQTSDVDWSARTASRYSSDLISSASRWRTDVAQSAQAPEPVVVDVTKLNDGQRFVYQVVAEHHERRAQGPVNPLLALICGTAGSGKTFLIRALKQLLGSACRVLAPTGVAADNIGQKRKECTNPVLQARHMRVRLRSPRAHHALLHVQAGRHTIRSCHSRAPTSTAPTSVPLQKGWNCWRWISKALTTSFWTKCAPVRASISHVTTQQMCDCLFSRYLACAGVWLEGARSVKSTSS